MTPYRRWTILRAAVLASVMASGPFEIKLMAQKCSPLSRQARKAYSFLATCLPLSLDLFYRCTGYFPIPVDNYLCSGRNSTQVDIVVPIPAALRQTAVTARFFLCGRCNQRFPRHRPRGHLSPSPRPKRWTALQDLPAGFHQPFCVGDGFRQRLYHVP